MGKGFIKGIIDSEILDLNLDLIIEGLNEIISDSNFTALTEDGDVVVDIVNDELNKNNCTLEENDNVVNDKVQSLNDNFWLWFGSSKVVKNGKPLIMHHGGSFSSSESSTNNIFRGVGWFTAYKPDARRYAKQSGGNNLTSVYLKIENPLYSGKQEDGYMNSSRKSTKN
jgi:hypothetical protein